MRLEDIIALLRTLPLFARVDVEALRLLAFSAVQRNLRPGDTLFRRGELADGGYLVVSGAIVLDRADDGSPSPHVFGAGTLLGQMALFAPIERPATALAREPTSVLAFSRDLMLKVLDAHPESAVILRDTLAAESRRLGERLRNLAF
ncbi:Crp/Fnr family transcriptional regulator [Rhabdaerophilum calidifontis]|uniref:Crp/Fnr family transcriptional regulator n=1 Tax=Rhabdaerophilum calidifontis TaxID=2604328 RepID=UPI00123C25E7|nr:Crp/Fnr family transcriptional regulator [Rhabdaerophilum calidifontis]